MSSLFKRSLAAVVFLSSLLLPLAALAQGSSDAKPAPAAKSDWDVSLGAGAALVPTFEGSDRYRVMPVPLVSITYKDMITLDAKGLSAYWRTGDLRVGAGLTYNGGRADSKDDGLFGGGDDRLRGMGNIDAALGLKAFASYHLWMTDLSAAVTKYTGDDNDGVVVDLGLKVPYKLTDKFTLTPHAGATWANQDYMRTFFGVTAAQAARSGFARYEADAGIKDIRAGVDANYRFDEHWFLNMSADVKQLIGDAADSPISYSNTGVTVATMVGYRF
ncbi:MAG: MipA/OmpV family protein [Humidesulfovibrio sp.]|nr:MipA/OmpV family protein [Humidesulfovibrio sp.]